MGSNQVMKNMKVKTKLLVSFGILAALMLVIVVGGLVCILNIQSQMQSYATQNYEVTNALNQIDIHFEALQKNMYSALLYQNNATMRQQAEDEMAANLASIQENLQIVQGKYTGDQNYLTTFENAIDNTQTAVQRAQSNLANAQTLMENEVVSYVEQGQAALSSMLDYSTQRGDNLLSQMNTTMTLILWIFPSVLVIALIITVVLALRVTRTLVRPIKEIEAAIHELQKGNLKVTLEYTSGDELGHMADSLRDAIATLDSYVSDINNAMSHLADGDLTVQPSADFRGDFLRIVESIQDAINAFDHVLSQLALSADQVSSGSEQVSSGAQALSQGATEQASSVQELAASINEISAQVKENADNAKIASDKVNQVSGEMMSSNQAMGEMIQAMEEISKSSNEISKIIKTIEDIAFQTNILALNAAVEAARAGAAGKGFAVVAEEVRNLASRSAEASKDTSTLIENSLRAVKNGSEIADRTAQSLMSVVQDAQEVTDSINKISEASAQQSEAINQITVGVDQISAVVQTNSATAEESAAASEELSSQAQMLKNLVSGFTLKSNGSSSLGASTHDPYSDGNMIPSFHDDALGMGMGKY